MDMNKRASVVLGVAVLGLSSLALATKADAATNCQAFVNVGHGISIAPCIQVNSGNQVNEGGTVIKFISNPLIRNCVLETIIVDSTTGVRSYYDGPLSEAQCTVNADNH